MSLALIEEGLELLDADCGMYLHECIFKIITYGYLGHML